jgi:hypothetical protein
MKSLVSAGVTSSIQQSNGKVLNFHMAPKIKGGIIGTTNRFKPVF